MHLRELSRLRLGLALSALLAVLAAVWSVASISFFPPRLKSRSLEMATAYTQVMVDTPHSTLLDLRQNSDDIQNMANRALLVGSLTATQPVLAYIAQRAHVPASALEVQAPRDEANPRPRPVPGRSNGPTDLLRTTEQYRLDIQADPIVPFLDIYAQAPTASAAAELANGAVAGLADYVRAIGASQGTPQDLQVHLRQLGQARGTVINNGIQLQVAVLVFLAVFAGGCLVTVAISRIKRGWALEAASAAG